MLLARAAHGGEAWGSHALLPDSTSLRANDHTNNKVLYNIASI